MMRKTVFQFIKLMSDGGAETLIKDYALMMDPNIFDVKIVVFRDMPESANTQILQDRNIEIIPIYPVWNFLVRVWNKLFGRIYIPFRLKQIVAKEKPAVLHTHLELLRYLSPISNSLRGVKLLYTCHSLPEMYFSGRNRVDYSAAKKLIENNNMQMIGLHDDMRKELNELFRIENSVVVRNGIDFRRFQNIKRSKEDIRKSLDIPEKAFVVGHVGRFHPVKNHSFLLDIFKEVCAKRDDAFLLLVGHGVLFNSVAEQIRAYGLSDKVLMLSHRTDIPELMKAMDVFVFPSVYEGLPLTLIEAQTVGLKCVVSDVVNQEAFKTNLVIPLSINRRPQDWCDVILNENLYGNYPNSLEDYDMNKEIKRLEKLYLEEYI